MLQGAGLGLKAAMQASRANTIRLAVADGDQLKTELNVSMLVQDPRRGRMSEAKTENNRFVKTAFSHFIRITCQ